MIFSGDVSKTGTLEQLDFAREALFEPLRKRLYVAKKTTFLVPGNHDVNRSAISFAEESNLRKLDGVSDAEAPFIASAVNDQRLSNYYAFVKSYKDADCAPFCTFMETVRGLKIGVACLNSAWRCSDDQDQGRLFLTSYQVNAAAEALQHAHLKIAVLHHPLDWYHKTEKSVVQHDLKRQFDIVLTGHLHSPISLDEHTPAHKCLLFSAPALFEGKLRDGYNLYSINYEEKKLRAYYRKFMRVRAEFDKDTEHAADGCEEFSLPLTELATHSKIVLVQRINDVADEMQSRMKEQLKLFQPAASPVLVTPNIVEIARKGGMQVKLAGRRQISDIANNNAIVYGAHETGKTIVLESVVSYLNDAASSSQTEELAVYLDFKQEQTLRTTSDIEAFTRREIRRTAPDILPLNITLVADHVAQRDPAQVEALREIADRNGWRLILALSNNLMLDAISSGIGFHAFRFFEVTPWGPSRIREFIVRVFHGTQTDVDAAYNFITTSLRDTDLPATPVVVGLYLSVFPTVGEKISSLSFLRLLEKIEQVRLDSQELSSTYSLYNKREILIRLAALCDQAGTLSVNRVLFETLICNFFKEKLLDVDVTKFVRILEESKIVRLSSTDVEFSYYVFHDYYLAKALEKGELNIASKISSLEECIKMSQALAFYGGLFREDSIVVTKILEFMEGTFGNLAEFRLADLDGYISDLLHPAEKGKAAEASAREKAATKIDYEQEDVEFQQTKDKYGEQRKRLSSLSAPKNRLEKMVMEVESLKTFYNLFRNLENLSGQQKMALLDRILDFHIQSNVDLISFFNQLFEDKSFKTFNAYFVTVGGQRFLSANVGNQSLQQTIIEALNRCNNDFKELLLTNLYADLRLTGYLKLMEDFLAKTSSPAAIELIYHKARGLLIEYEEPELPERLVQLFKTAFEKRQQLYGSRDSKGTFNKAVQEAIASRNVFWSN